MIFPDRVFGNTGVKSISVGTAIGPSSFLTCSFNALTMSSDPDSPALSVTNPLICSPFISSGFPITAASATAGCDTSALSTSADPILCPATFSTSSAPTNHHVVVVRIP